MSFDETAHVKVIEDGTTQERRVPMQEFADVLSPLLPAPPGSYTDEEAVDAVAAALVNGAGITISYNDGLDQITITCTITQYTDGMADARVAAGIATHEAAGNPHPVYLTQAEADALYEVVGAVATHVGLADPHTQYLKESDFNLSTFTTADLAEGANLYFTNERVDDRINALFVEGAGVDFVYDDGANTFTVTVDLSELSTTTLPEGTNLYYTDERVDDRVAALLIEGTGINLTYNDVANTLEVACTLSAPTMGVATADFGAFPGSQQVQVTVSGQAGLVASSKIQAWVAPIATADHGIDDHICESQFLKATPYYSVDGTFIIQVETINPPQTRYPPSRQGDKYRVWDDFSIGWSWAN